MLAGFPQRNLYLLPFVGIPWHLYLSPNLYAPTLMLLYENFIWGQDGIKKKCYMNLGILYANQCVGVLVEQRILIKLSQQTQPRCLQKEKQRMDEAKEIQVLSYLIKNVLLKKKIGTGSSINIWQDPSLTTNFSPRPIN